MEQEYKELFEKQLEERVKTNEILREIIQTNKATSEYIKEHTKEMAYFRGWLAKLVMFLVGVVALLAGVKGIGDLFNASQ